MLHVETFLHSDAEQAFAAAVANARGNAKLADTAGFPQTAFDQVMCALVELWEDGRNEGLSGDDIQAVVDQWVFWDEHDNPWPREMADNVTPLRR